MMARFEPPWLEAVNTSCWKVTAGVGCCCHVLPVTSKRHLVGQCGKPVVGSSKLWVNQVSSSVHSMSIGLSTDQKTMAWPAAVRLAAAGISAEMSNGSFRQHGDTHLSPAHACMRSSCERHKSKGWIKSWQP